MNKYERVLEALNKNETPSMKVFGNSMTPKIESGAILTYQRFDTYEIGDIVFATVKGRKIDAHLITKKDGNRYMISNNHNYDNGWTTKIHGKVIKIEYSK